jgi:hypothetical protein
MKRPGGHRTGGRHAAYRPALNGDLSDLQTPLLDGVAAVEEGARWLVERRGTPDALAGAGPTCS